MARGVNRVAIALLGVAWACGGSTGGGFYSSSIEYRPKVVAPGPDAQSVTLRVENRRPAKEGGENPRRVGTMRAAVGYGVGIHEKDPETVNRLVAKATEVGLARGGLAAAPDGGAVFEVWVSKFWMEGSSDYSVDIEATLFLRRGAQELWRRPVKVHVDTTQVGVERPRDLYSRGFSQALARYAEEVGKALKAPAFVQALPEALRDAPAAPSGKGSAMAQAHAPRGLGLSVKGSGGVPGGPPQERFQHAAQDALRHVGIPVLDGHPHLAVRYALDIERGEGESPVVVGISTRLALRTATGRTLWEQWLTTRTPLDLASGSAGNEALDAAVTQVIDRQWRQDVVACLKSRAFLDARAAAR